MNKVVFDEASCIDEVISKKEEESEPKEIGQLSLF